MLDSEYVFGTEDGWTVEYGNTGGGVMCWVASHPLRPADDQLVYFGTSAGVWDGSFESPRPGAGYAARMREFLDN